MSDLMSKGELFNKLATVQTLGVTYGIIQEMPTVDAVEVVRCLDCKHRPTGTNRDDLEFPDDKCPCQCEDYWYNWKPADNWFCGNGERKDGDHHDNNH